MIDLPATGKIKMSDGSLIVLGSPSVHIVNGSPTDRTTEQISALIEADAQALFLVTKANR